jgi:molybdenum cofactor cytidylyltransferase
LILASGRGERFLASGGTTHKLDALLPTRGGLPAKTVLQATVDAVVESGLPYHIERSGHAGMGDTIAAAVVKTQDANGWLMLPADMPLIDPNAILAVAQALQLECDPASDVAITLPMVDGQRGHPVGFPKACLNDLLALAGDEGAKSLFQKFQTKKIHVDKLPEVHYPEGCLIDMDTVSDLEKINNLLLQRLS